MAKRVDTNLSDNKNSSFVKLSKNNERKSLSTIINRLMNPDPLNFYENREFSLGETEQLIHLIRKDDKGDFEKLRDKVLKDLENNLNEIDKFYKESNLEHLSTEDEGYLDYNHTILGVYKAFIHSLEYNDEFKFTGFTENLDKLFKEHPLKYKYSSVFANGDSDKIEAKTKELAIGITQLCESINITSFGYFGNILYRGDKDAIDYCYSFIFRILNSINAFGINNSEELDISHVVDIEKYFMNAWYGDGSLLCTLQISIVVLRLYFYAFALYKFGTWDVAYKNLRSARVVNYLRHR